MTPTTGTPPPPPPKPTRRVAIRDPQVRTYEDPISSDDSVRVAINSPIPTAKEELENPHDTLPRVKKEEVEPYDGFDPGTP